MSFTRFKYDEARIIDENKRRTFEGKYQISKPGPGGDAPFLEDPYTRLEFHGANLTTNKTDLESDFRGLTRKLNRDLITNNDYKLNAVKTESLSYSKMNPFTQESRASHPAWTYKDLEQSRWEIPFINPTANTEIPFHNNLSSRLIEKDGFKPNIPNI
mgnify:FL=1|tara:strand:- start:16 stop:489 length:474 start_codon:yes stop_codon:yes gene_type:complete